jgi:hypothetical protein
MRHAAVHIDSEEEYFHRLDAELIEKMRTCAASEEWRRRLAEASQVRDSKVLESLEKLGYTPTTVRLLRLVPLVQVAWSDGWVSPIERDRIVAIAGLHEVKENTPGYQQLMAWLDQRPPEEFFEGTLSAIRAVLESLPPDQRETCRSAILDGCREVASASCGFFGWASRICGAKCKLVDEIGKRLEPEPRIAAGGPGTGSAHI